MSAAHMSSRDFRASQYAKPEKPRKYRNTPVMVDGVRFDSKGESVRWQELKLLERAGEISDLHRQQSFPLKVNGQLVATMILDFAYRDHKGDPVFEDFKGCMTPEWALKAKLFRAITGMEVKIT